MIQCTHTAVKYGTPYNHVQVQRDVSDAISCRIEFYTALYQSLSDAQIIPRKIDRLTVFFTVPTAIVSTKRFMVFVCTVL